jgi:hypothetical protein
MLTSTDVKGGLMMRAAFFQITSATLMCLATAASAGAQTPAPAPSEKPQKTVTIVGCLERGAPTGAGNQRRSDTGAANANDFFVRTPAIAVPVGTTITVGKPGTTAPSTSGSPTTTSAGTPNATTVYRVTGLDRERLEPHVGHRVELQGHLTDNTPKTTAATTVDASGRATTRVENRLDVAGVLHATALKMVNTSCP